MNCSTGSLCFAILKGIPAGIATLIVDAGDLVIAYHLLRMARIKLKLDRYDKRYAVF